MTVGELRDGHQEYTFIQPPTTSRDTGTMRYLSRFGSDGKLDRFVVCYSVGACRHLVRMETYDLSYETPATEFPNWETSDRKFAELVNSWQQARQER